MKGTPIPVLAGCVAALILTASRPAAAAMSAMPVIQYDKADGALVQQVHRKWRKRAYSYYGYPYPYHRYGSYGCSAGYLPFGFRPDIYYGCPGYGWPYWRRPAQIPVPLLGAPSQKFREDFSRHPVAQSETSYRKAAHPNQAPAAGMLMASKHASGELSKQNDLTFCLKWAHLGTLVCRRPDGIAERFAANSPL